MTARFWCFTLNNPDGLLDVTLEEWLDNGLRYAVYQHEVGESGTEHFQGYLELDRGQRLSYVAARLPGAHLEQRRGTQEQAIAYCKKDEGRLDGPWEFGTPTAGQGARSDIAAFKKAVDDGATDLELWNNLPNMYLRYERMLPKIRALTQVKRTWKSHVTLCYGPPGAGKSTWCKNQAPDAYWKQPNSKWWDGYTNQEDVVMDDYKSWLPWATLLQVLDANPLTVEIKGAQVSFAARRIFVTTNFLPCDWYASDEDLVHKYPLHALTRRINEYKHFIPGNDFPGNPDDLTINTYDNYDSFIHAVNNFH